MINLDRVTIMDLQRIRGSNSVQSGGTSDAMVFREFCTFIVIADVNFNIETWQFFLFRWAYTIRWGALYD